MGKQVNFFMAEKDELLFLEKVEELGYIIYNDDDERNRIQVDKNDIICSNWLELYISFNGANIPKDGEFINQICSEIVQYSRCRSWVEGNLSPGRIWGEFKYWDSNDELATKSSEFNEMYNTLAKWLKKNMKLSTDKSFYIGEYAYQLYKEKQYVMREDPKYTVEFL